MPIRLPDPPRNGPPEFVAWANQMKRALEVELDNLSRNYLLPTFSGTATSTSSGATTRLPPAALPSRLIYAVGSSGTGPAWNNGTAWYFFGTSSVPVI